MRLLRLGDGMSKMAVDIQLIDTKLSDSISQETASRIRSEGILRDSIGKVAGNLNDTLKGILASLVVLFLSAIGAIVKFASNQSRMMEQIKTLTNQQA